MGNALKIITRKDGTFAISDAVARAIKQARSWIALASPWADMGLAEYFREAERALTVLFLTKIPEPNNRVDERTLETIDALQQILNEKGGSLEVRYSPKLHDKFIVNKVLALKGSLNYTTCGRYHNFESLEVIDEPNAIRELEEWFKFMWKHPSTKASARAHCSRNRKNFDPLEANHTITTHLKKHENETEEILIELVQRIFACARIVVEGLLERMYREGVIYLCNEHPRVYALTRA